MCHVLDACQREASHLVEAASVAVPSCHAHAEQVAAAVPGARVRALRASEETSKASDRAGGDHR